MFHNKTGFVREANERNTEKQLNGNGESIGKEMGWGWVGVFHIPVRPKDDNACRRLVHDHRTGLRSQARVKIDMYKKFDILRKNDMYNEVFCWSPLSWSPGRRGRTFSPRGRRHEAVGFHSFSLF